MLERAGAALGWKKERPNKIPIHKNSKIGENCITAKHGRKLQTCSLTSDCFLYQMTLYGPKGNAEGKEF
jgi:hypothetical protein